MKKITFTYLAKTVFASLTLLFPLTGNAQNPQRPSVVDSLNAERMIVNGSVDKVTEDRMNKGLVTNSLSALSGQAAGVTVSNADNRMAMLSSVRVRGTTSLTGGNDPLVVFARCLGCHSGEDEDGARRAIPYLLRRQYRPAVSIQAYRHASAK